MPVTTEAIESIAIGYFDDIHPAHDRSPVERRYRTAKTLAEPEGRTANRSRQPLFFTISVGAGRIEGTPTTTQHGGEDAAAILPEFDVSGEQIAGITHCIRARRYSTSFEPRTPEARVLSDPNDLDAPGATGMARAFTYGGGRRTPISIPGRAVEADVSGDGQTAPNHLQNPILRLLERMYADTG